MTAPNIDLSQVGGYNDLKEIYDQAVNFLHGRTKSGKKYTRQQVDEWVASTVGSGSPIRNFHMLVNSIQGLDRAGLRPVSPDDLSPIEKGAIARTQLVGHGMSFGWSDELSGVINAALHPTQNIVESYKSGRDEARSYIDNARAVAANRGILNPELWGNIAGGIAAGGRAPGPMGLLKGAGVGGGLSLLGSVGELPDVSPATLKEEAIPLALNTAVGAVLGGGGALAGKRLAAFRQPGPVKLDKVLEAAGGEAGLGRAVEASGTPRPMLSELSETSFGRLANELRRASQEAQTAALQRVAEELQGVQQAKQAVAQQYRVLEQPIPSERAGEILSKPRVARAVRTLVQDGVIQPGQQVTGRALEDIRQELAAQARRAYARGNGRVGKLLKGYATELQNIIDGSVEGMPQARADYAPLAQREARLQQMMRQLSRQARGSGIPVENKVTAHSELLQEMGGEPWQRAQRAARQMIEPLYTPGTAAEHAARLHASMPWYSRLGNVAAPSAAAVPQLTDPFFPLRQLSDSGQ